jgi:hypothetical protein
MNASYQRKCAEEGSIILASRLTRCFVKKSPKDHGKSPKKSPNLVFVKFNA